MRKILKADGPSETINCEAADGCEARIGCGRIRATVNHGVRNFDAGGESVEDDASGFLLKNVDELAIGGEIVFVSEDGRG